MIRAIALALAAALTAVSSPAHGAPGAGDRWAVLVGVNDYGKDVERLQCPASDARRVVDALTDARIGGLMKDHVRLLATDEPAGAPTRDNIMQALTSTISRMAPGDTLWFYFSGHGLGSGTETYLLTANTRMSDLDGTTISSRLLWETLSKAPAGSHGIVVLDACQSAGFIRSRKGVRVVEKVAGVLAACGAREWAYEYADLPGSVFTYYLLRALTGEADSDRDGAVTLGEGADYTVAEVAQAVRARGGEQTPASSESGAALTLAGRPGGPPLPGPRPDSSEHRLARREPLGPIVLVLMEEKRRQLEGDLVSSEIAATAVRQGLIERHFPLIDQEAAALLRGGEAPGSGSDVAEKASKVGAQYLLIGSAETSARNLVARMVTVTATITAQLVDRDGRVLQAIDVSSDPKLRGTELAAANEALRQAADRLLEQVVPAVEKAEQERRDREAVPGGMAGSGT